MQGIEASAEENNVLVERIQLFGSATSVDSRIVSDPTSAGTNPLTGNPDTVVGNRVPYVPDWRVKFGHVPANRRLGVDDRCALQQQAVLDLVNTDIAPHVYGAFDKYIV